MERLQSVLIYNHTCSRERAGKKSGTGSGEEPGRKAARASGEEIKSGAGSDKKKATLHPKERKSRQSRQRVEKSPESRKVA